MTTVCAEWLCVPVQDGDEYMVVWDPELLPEDESEPMDYTAEKPKEVGHSTQKAPLCSIHIISC
jgi:hypothetical protein